MSVSEERSNTDDRPPSIVCIAYRQLSLMTGVKDPTEPPRKEKEENTEIEKQGFLQFPTSFMATLCTTYRNIKGTHETVTSVLDSVESGLERIKPVSDKVGNALESMGIQWESPLKDINDTISTSLDFLGERIPSVYEITRNYFRDIVGPIIAAMIATFRDKIQQLSITDGVESKGKEDNGKNTSISEMKRKMNTDLMDGAKAMVLRKGDDAKD